MTHVIELSQIQAAQQAIAKQLIATPLLHSGILSRELGICVYLKLENLQPTRSFKVRAALYTLSSLSPAERQRGVVTASTGNHGQATAYVAQQLGMPAYIVVPANINAERQALIARWGAQVIAEGAHFEASCVVADRIAAETGALHLRDGADPHIMIGAATLGLDMIEAQPDLDTVIIPVGGGNLIAGVASAIKAVSPHTRVIGVQSESAPAVHHSWHAKAFLTDRCETFAEGIATTGAGPLALEAMLDLVDDMWLVSDEEMKREIPTLLNHLATLAEGAGAAGVAACRHYREQLANQRVGLLISGGNLRMQDLQEILNHHT